MGGTGGRVVTDVEAAKKRVHQLLLSGDNTLKNRDDPERFGRARGRFEEAATVAREAGLDDALIIIDRRIALLDGSDAT